MLSANEHQEEANHLFPAFVSKVESMKHKQGKISDLLDVDKINIFQLLSSPGSKHTAWLSGELALEKDNWHIRILSELAEIPVNAIFYDSLYVKRLLYERLQEESYFYL